MKSIKKLLTVMLSLVLILSVIPMSALTANAAVSGYYTYEVSNEKATITDFNEYVSGAISIPSSLGGYPVTVIGDYAFEDCSELTAITIPNTVVTIGESAFSNCENLLSVTIPDSITEIKEYAFGYCQSLTSVTIPNSVIRIGDYAFEDCYELAQITIPNSNISIGKGAFSDTKYSNISDNWTDDVLYIGNHLIEYDNYSSDEYTVKEGTKTIADGAFSQIDITSVKIPNSVTHIGDYAFSSCCYLSSVSLPNNVSIINKGLFSDCTSLENITLPNSVVTIADNSFSSCYELKAITIPKSVKSIGDYAFSGCSSLETITIPDNVTSMGDGVFRYCSNLKSIMLSSSIKSIGENAFSDCVRLAEISIPDSVTEIKEEAFEYCQSLTSVIIPNEVKSIGNNAFRCCTYLSSVTVPRSVSSIGYCAFEYCEDIEIKLYKNSYAESYCKDNYLEYTYIPCNHNPILKGNYAATCTKTGLKDRTVCSICGDVINKGTTIAKKAHTYKTTTTKATTSKDGKVVKKCSVCGATTTTTIKKIKTVKLSATSYTYNGKTKKPSVSVKDSAGKTISSSNYTVSYQSGRKNVGKYKVVIKFKGNYSGSKTLYFTIKPVKTTVKSITAGKKQLKVNITKKSTQVTGYQIQYSTSKKFTSAKTKTINSYKTTSATIKSLKAKKTYYVRIRTFKTVGKTKYYSAWSSAKSKKTK